MKTARLLGTLALVILSTACATRSSSAPPPQKTQVAAPTSPSLLPLLYVIDGVRQPLDQVPKIDPAQVASIEVVKGRAALLKYGPDASYGVVLVTTKRVAASH